MRGHGAKFGRKKEAAIALLLTHRNTEEAARAISVVQATLLRWMKDSEFDAAYREARRLAFRQSVARLQQVDLKLVPLAVQVYQAAADAGLSDHCAAQPLKQGRAGASSRPLRPDRCPTLALAFCDGFPAGCAEGSPRGAAPALRTAKSFDGAVQFIPLR